MNPVSIEQGEENNLIVAQAKFNCNIHATRTPPSPDMPTRQQVVFSDGLAVPVADIVFRDMFFMTNLCTATGHDISSIMEADVFSQQLSYTLVSPFSNCTGMKRILLSGSVEEIATNMFGNMPQLEEVFFAGKSLDQVSQMANYPWGITNTDVIKAELD